MQITEKLSLFDVNLILFLTFAKNKVVYRIMEEAIKLIGERLKGLRESLDISVEEMAETCGVTDEKYLKMEEYVRLKQGKQRLILPLLVLQVVMSTETAGVLVVIVIVVCYLMPQSMRNMQRTS